MSKKCLFFHEKNLKIFLDQIVERLHQYVLDKDISLIQVDDTPLPESCYEVPFVFVNETYYGGIDEIPIALKNGEFHEKMSEEPKMLQKMSDWTDQAKKPKKSRAVLKITISVFRLFFLGNSDF